MAGLDDSKANFKRQDLIRSKIGKLEEIIASLGRIVIAYSGGVDSNLLLRFAKEVLKDKVIAITASSEIIPRKEVEEAKKLAKEVGVNHQIIFLQPLKNPDFIANTPERCYFCKYDLCAHLQNIAKREGAFFVVDGTNKDDMKDYRPGQKAASEWDVRSPLLEAGLTKEDIRLVSKSLNLPTWDKPSKACLASRFPYGQKITEEKLKRVEKAEEVISSLGLNQVRVRFHDEKTARIEVEQEEIGQLLGSAKRSKIVSELQELGFIYITVDLKGYQTGSVNELLKEERY